MLRNRLSHQQGPGFCLGSEPPGPFSCTIESSCAGRLGSVQKGIRGDAGCHLHFAYFSWMNLLQWQRRILQDFLPTHKFSWKCHWPKTVLNFVWIDSFLHRHFPWQNSVYLLWLGYWAVCFLSNIGLWAQENKYRTGAMSPFLFYGLMYGSWASFDHSKYVLRKK